MGARQHEEPRERLLGRVRDVRRRPADLLQVTAEFVDLDRLELGDPCDGTHDLDPAAIHARLDAVQLIEAVVAVLLLPEGAGDGIKGHAEAVPDPIGEDFLNVRAYLPTNGGASGVEGVIRRGASVVVQPKDHTGQMRVVGLRPAELVIGVSRRRALGQVLRLPAPAVGSPRLMI